LPATSSAGTIPQTATASSSPTARPSSSSPRYPHPPALYRARALTATYIDLSPQVCRPEECPFDDERGCRVVSTCMQPDIIKQYKEALAT
jgi:hypothetical protein